MVGRTSCLPTRCVLSTVAASHFFRNAPCSDISSIHQPCSAGRAQARRVMASAGAAQLGQQRRRRCSRPRPLHSSQGQHTLTVHAPRPPASQFLVPCHPPRPPRRRCLFPAQGQQHLRPSGHSKACLLVLATLGNLHCLPLPARHHPSSRPRLGWAGAAVAAPFCWPRAALRPPAGCSQWSSPSQELRRLHGGQILPLLPVKQQCHTQWPGHQLHTCKHQQRA